MTHTPAPWSIEWHDGYAYIMSANGADVVQCNTQDARLIAAAPDLLAALQALLHHVPVPRVPMGNDFGNPFPLPDYITQARAAIARATGEA